ncbi:hypothetical protein CORC01_10052 [Colletotrichum orchidophilum]|uniref:Uncharacterized protein n=1 Tax=Colletotrichum orchidophilum TaxID=1209926 RepID=A0A1G4AZU4_9PEZI|nr:uncharacterized protein CORC01_10052 [Colletotrichum orchidophilum]OHE94651.1 hypothetical protein CORC01_10052 [Colletotrichum orchidophilum]
MVDADGPRRGVFGAFRGQERVFFFFFVPGTLRSLGNKGKLRAWRGDNAHQKVVATAALPGDQVQVDVYQSFLASFVFFLSVSSSVQLRSSRTLVRLPLLWQNFIVLIMKFPARHLKTC